MESLDDVYADAYKCKTSIDSPRESIQKKKFSPRPHLYRAESQNERGYNDKTYERNNLFSKLISLTLSRMNYYFHKQKQEVSDEDLVRELLAEYPAILAEVSMQDEAQVRALMVDAYTAGMDGGLNSKAKVFSWEYAERQCTNAVTSAREFWTPEVFLEIQRKAREQGARGGRAYKSYSLESHLQTAHLSVTAASRALGVSRPTIYRMRQEFADIDLSTGEVHDTKATSHAEPTPAMEVRDSVGERTPDSSHGLEDSFSDRSERQNSYSSDATGMRAEPVVAFTGPLPF